MLDQLRMGLAPTLRGNRDRVLVVRHRQRLGDLNAGEALSGELVFRVRVADQDVRRTLRALLDRLCRARLDRVKLGDADLVIEGSDLVTEYVVLAGLFLIGGAVFHRLHQFVHAGDLGHTQVLQFLKRFHLFAPGIKKPARCGLWGDSRDAGRRDSRRA